MTDAASGKVFSCPDGTLEGKLAGAASVALPHVPALTDVEAPSHAQGVRRGLEIVMLRTPFDPRIDSLPFLAGIAVDLLLVIFIRAKSRLNRPADGPGPNSSLAAGRVVVGMRHALGQRSTLATLGNRLTTALDAEPWLWLDLVQAWSARSTRHLRIAVPCEIDSHEDARKLRAIVQLLARSTDQLALRMTVPAAKLPGRLGSWCESELGPDRLVDVYRGPADLLAQLDHDWILWALSRGEDRDDSMSPRAA
jgi:hypothetical protein